MVLFINIVFMIEHLPVNRATTMRVVRSMPDTRLRGSARAHFIAAQAQRRVHSPQLLTSHSWLLEDNDHERCMGKIGESIVEVSCERHSFTLCEGENVLCSILDKANLKSKLFRSKLSGYILLL